MLKNKNFCILPWMALYISPEGNTAPCCIFSDYTMGSTQNTSIKEIYNNQKNQKFRLDMLQDKPLPKGCSTCIAHEEAGINSNRKHCNKEWGHLLEDSLARTNLSTGYIGNIQFRYIDVRLSNICNMKCRTCGPSFSSLWAQEENERLGTDYSPIIEASSDKQDLLAQVYELLPTVDKLYFAGGEPLISEEHYLILEKLCELGLSNKVDLVYNTNISVLGYKKNNILDVWKKFKSINVAASIDHYRERAEYIRHGTNWGNIETNLNILSNFKNIFLMINSVASVFTYVTYTEFHSYIRDNFPGVRKMTFYPLVEPKYFSTQILPPSLKEIGTERIQPIQLESLAGLIKRTHQQDTWEELKLQFYNAIELRDKIRGEDFCKTFPELASMYG